MRALFNSSGEKLFPAVEARFSTLLLPLPIRTHTYSQSSLLFTLSDDQKYGYVCRLLHAIVVVQCGKDLTKMNVCYVLVQSIDDLKRHEKVAALERWRFDSILCR